MKLEFSNLIESWRLIEAIYLYYAFKGQPLSYCTRFLFFDRHQSRGFSFQQVRYLAGQADHLLNGKPLPSPGSLFTFADAYINVGDIDETMNYFMKETMKRWGMKSLFFAGGMVLFSFWPLWTFT